MVFEEWLAYLVIFRFFVHSVELPALHLILTCVLGARILTPISHGVNQWFSHFFEQTPPVCPRLDLTPPFLPLLFQNLHLNPTPQPFAYEMGRPPFKTQLQYVISSRWQGFDLYFILLFFDYRYFDTIFVSGIWLYSLNVLESQPYPQGKARYD